jgi:hypothetical protein
MPCGLAGGYQHFGETYCPHSITIQNNNTDIFTAVKTSNLTNYSLLLGYILTLTKYNIYKTRFVGQEVCTV